MVTKSQIASARTGVDFPKALADGKTVFDNATAMFMDDDGGTALHPEFTNNVLNVNFLKAFLGDLTPDAFSAKMVSDAKTYWSTHTV
jgi:hypothetical protein